MKPYTIIGLFLIIVAITAFAYQGISLTTREKVVDIGPLQMTAVKTRTLPITPVAGGIALLIVGLKKN